MPLFDVTFLDAGRPQSRRVDAAELQAAARQPGVPLAHVLSVKPAAVQSVSGKQSARPSGAAVWQGFGRSTFPLRLFSQELAVLLAAGIPLLEAVVTLREKEDSAAIAGVLSQVAGALQQGEALSAALGRQTEAFDALFVAVVAAAERSGQLAQALRAHAAYLHWVETLRHKLAGALVYPLLLVGSSGAVMLFLLMFVVPRFAGVLEGVAGEMPAGSRWLLQVGQWFGAHPGTVLVLLVLAGFALLLGARSAWARARLSAVAWSLPLLGNRLRLLALARLFRTLGMLLAAGVPAVSAMCTARSVVAPHLRGALDEATDAVSRGLSMSAAFDAAGLCTPVSSRMLRVGERSGALGPMLDQAAAFYDEELVRLGDLVTQLVNPVLMLLMGGLIGAVVVLLYLPIFQLAEQVP